MNGFDSVIVTDCNYGGVNFDVVWSGSREQDRLHYGTLPLHLSSRAREQLHQALVQHRDRSAA